DAENAGGLDEFGAVLVEGGKRHMGGHRGQLVLVEERAEALGIGFVSTAEGLDGIEADRREGLELRLQWRKLARAIELKGNAVVRHVAVSWVGGSEPDAGFGVEDGGQPR